MYYYQKLIDNAEETYEMENKTHYVGAIGRNELGKMYLDLQKEGYIEDEIRENGEEVVLYDFFDY